MVTLLFNRLDVISGQNPPIGATFLAQITFGLSTSSPVVGRARSTLIAMLLALFRTSDTECRGEAGFPLSSQLRSPLEGRKGGKDRTADVLKRGAESVPR